MILGSARLHAEELAASYCYMARSDGPSHFSLARQANNRSATPGVRSVRPCVRAGIARCRYREEAAWCLAGHGEATRPTGKRDANGVPMINVQLSDVDFIRVFRCYFWAFLLDQTNHIENDQFNFQNLSKVNSHISRSRRI